MGFSYAQNEEVVIRMASRIQGITVEIGGDTTKLSKALESVNKSIKGTQSGLKDVNKLLKLDPSNTELVVQKQKMLKDAIVQRGGDDDNFYVFDTICGATQDRQDALYELLKNPLDVMFVVGGYNSSNTTHLVDIAREHVPTYFIESAECIKSIQYVDAFDTKTREVRRMTTEPVVQNLGKSLKVGITAGASCPANLIEATILRIADLRK